MVHGARLPRDGGDGTLPAAPGRERRAAFASPDPDSSRIWWSDGGVHQNLTFPVHPDPVSGMHCWHQKVVVPGRGPEDRYGDVFVDTRAVDGGLPRVAGAGRGPGPVPAACAGRSGWTARCGRRRRCSAPRSAAPDGVSGIVFLYLTLGLSGLGVAVLVYRYDLYDREPKALLVATVALGAAAMTLAGRLESATLARLHTNAPPVLAWVGASYEEALKLLVVILIALFARRAFNDPMDGLIYGSMAGLGAALEEGVAVIRALPRATGLVPPEELVRLCGHLVMGGIGGFGMSCVVTKRPRALAAVALSLFTAVALHFGWDLVALSADAGVVRAGRNGLLGAALMLAGLLLYGRLVVLGSRWSKDVFAPDLPPPKVWQWPWTGRS